MRGVIFFCLKKEPTGFLFPLRLVHAWWWYAVQVYPKGGSRSLLFNVTTRKCRSFRPCPLSVNDVWETKTISIYSLPLFASFFLNSGVCYDRKVKRKLRKKTNRRGTIFKRGNAIQWFPMVIKMSTLLKTQYTYIRHANPIMWYNRTYRERWLRAVKHSRFPLGGRVVNLICIWWPAGVVYICGIADCVSKRSV